MASPEEVTGSVESEPSEASEPDIELDVAAENEMDLHPDLTGDHIQRIVDDGNAHNTQGENIEANAPEGGAENTKKRKVKEKLTSQVWQHFKRGETQDDGSYDAVCNYCAHVYPMGNQRDTGSLRHHVKSGCEKIPARHRHKRTRLQQMLQVQTGPVEGENKVAVWKFDQATCRKNLSIMVIVHEYPFNIVTHHYFRMFLKSLQPEFKLISRNTLRSDCIGVYDQERIKLYEEIGNLDCKVSFSSDLWTNGSGDRGFIALTCHYIDDSWKIRKRVINFSPLPSPHTGKNIAEALHSMMIMWNLDKRAFSLVLDNLSSNDACIRELLSGPLKEDLPVDGLVFHQRCGCHILNLIVQDGLSDLSGDITKIRDTMKYIRHSQARMENFQLAASQIHAPYKKPAWDVPTRWNSTYLMLELALHLRPIINRFAEIDKNYKLNLGLVEWEAMEALMECLKIFYSVTLKFSASKYPSLNLFFPEMCEVFVNIQNMGISPYPFIVSMSKKMFRKWEKYWTIGNALLAIACVLDPRCKLQVVEYYYKIIYPSNFDCYMTNLKACIGSLFKEYLETYSRKVQSQAGASTPQSQSKQACGSSSATVSQVRAGLKDFISGLETTEPEKSELEEYLGLPLDKTSVDDEFDILTWWKMKVPKYPVLSRLARDILAVPSSTVASESTFSTSGRTLSYVRNCLNDESMEALICAQDWLRARVAENGGDIGASMWVTDNLESDDTICSSQAQ